MKINNFIRIIALILSFLIISLPIAIAEEFNRVYDANGNLISDGKYYREYNGLNQLARIKLGNTSSSPILEEYKWHPIEERIVIKKVFSNDVLNYTIYYPNENYVYIVNSSGSYSEKYIYQDGMLVAQVNSDGQKQAIHSDHEGSTTLITDSSGNTVENTFFSPYGEILDGGKASRFQYEGKEYDSLVDDIDFHFRKYNPKIPILHQPDDRIPNLYDSQSLNRYMFERGNPMKNKDDDGHVVQLAPILIGAGIGLAAGLGTYFATHDDYTWRGALSYAGGGAVAGGAGVINVYLALAGGAFGQVAANYGDENSLGEGVVLSAGLSAVSYGLADELLPLARRWLIKNPLSWFTTKTGQTFIANQFTEQTASAGGVIGANWLAGTHYYAKAVSQSIILNEYFRYQTYFTDKKDTSSGGGASGGGGGCRCGPWGDLREEAQKAKPGETAGDIIRRWREKNK